MTVNRPGKDDIQDAAKLNTAVRGAIGELLDKEFPNVPDNCRAAVAGWMENDPVMRAKVIRLLERSA